MHPPSKLMSCRERAAPWILSTPEGVETWTTLDRRDESGKGKRCLVAAGASLAPKLRFSESSTPPEHSFSHDAMRRPILPHVALCRGSPRSRPLGHFGNLRNGVSSGRRIGVA